jgi:two-component system sensor histidine kinase YesM
MFFEIADNGIGIVADKLEQLRSSINNEPFLSGDNGFGLCNVNQRIKLYYGKQFGLTIQSEYGVGTKVSAVIPLQ